MTAPSIDMLLEGLTGGQSLRQFCNIISDEINYPVAIALTTETLIAHSDTFTEDFIKEFTSSTDYMNEEEITEMHAAFQNILKTGKPHVQAWPYLRHKQINCGCVYKDFLVATLLIPVYSSNPQKTDMRFIENAARIIAMWFVSNGYITNRHSQSIQNFLLGMIKGDLDVSRQRSHLHYVGALSASAYRIIWIRPVSDENNSAEFEYQLAGICKTAEKWWHVRYEDGYVVLIDADCHKPLNDLDEFLHKKKAVACVSDIYSKLEDSKKNLDIISTILPLCQSYGIDERLYFLDDYKYLYQISFAKKNLPDYMFTSQKLQSIIDYDLKNSSSYLETLRMYYRNNRNYDQMAKALHVHRNTVFYRMNRLNEIFSLNLDDTIQYVELLTALLIYDEII
ncbi:MAG: helix-turn-helix domain-containing protein [Clostridiales bacterium]|nr:helix-turn-helix domain-containing protein [Clostridiales bacterium]